MYQVRRASLLLLVVCNYMLLIFWPQIGGKYVGETLVRTIAYIRPRTAMAYILSADPNDPHEWCEHEYREKSAQSDYLA